MSKKTIIVSRNSGFCFGVKRALDIAKKALLEKKKVYSLGPIIHNPGVVREFSDLGLGVIKDIRKIKDGKASLLVPSHGADTGILKRTRFDLIDTTCPFVEKVQAIVRDLRKNGYFVLIFGNKKHPEVKGLKGIAGRNSLVLETKAEARRFRAGRRKAALISQTTAALSGFEGILKEIRKKKIPGFLSFNTVCRNTIERRKEAEEIAGRVDAMFIIGGRESANTAKLASSCGKINKNTHHIESARDIKNSFLEDRSVIGIASGASTPPGAVREAVKRIKGIN